MGCKWGITERSFGGLKENMTSAEEIWVTYALLGLFWWITNGFVKIGHEMSVLIAIKFKLYVIGFFIYH